MLGNDIESEAEFKVDVEKYPYMSGVLYCNLVIGVEMWHTDEGPI